MKLIYINSGRNSVFDSQVLSLLDYFQKSDEFDEIYLLFGFKNNKDVKWVSSKMINKDIKLLFYKRYPNYPIFNYLNKRSIFNVIRSIEKDLSDFVFHIRGEFTSFFLKKNLYKLNLNPDQIVTDVRGVVLESVDEYSTKNNFLNKLKYKNYKNAFSILKNDKKISVVSKSLKAHIQNSLKIPQENIVINSCLVSQEFKFHLQKRKQLRNKLGITDNDLLIVFASGGSANWQNIDMVNEIAKQGYKILNLSKTKINHQNVINKFVPYNEVPGYLSSADIAFIWRDNNLVNNVASPVKFSEYVSCGLPIITNGSVHIINDFIIKYNCGLILNSINKIDHKDLSRLSKIDRNLLSKTGQAVFGVNRIAQQYINFFKA